MPEVKDFLGYINTVSYYSNVRLPDDIRHKYDILIKTKILDVIIDKIDFSQYQTIARAIEDKIDNRLCVNEQLFNNKINAAMSTLETLINSIKDLFGGITQEDINNLLGAIKNSSLDEEKLVNAYIKSKELTQNMSNNDIDAEPDKGASENGETIVD